MKSLISTVLATAAAASALSGAASAQSIVEEVRGGILAQACCGFGSNKEKGVGINAEAQFKSPRFLSVLGAPRPVVGLTVASDSDATSVFYAGLDWRVNLGKKFFVGTTLGGAVHNGETDTYDPIADADRVNETIFLGCRAAFRYGMDLGYWITDRVNMSVHWSHISNAGLCSENEGLDHLGARIGYRF